MSIELGGDAGFAQADEAGQRHQRPVVELGICMGSFYRVAQVNLNSRDRMRYKLLIGRRYLKKGIILDSSKRLTTEPNCPNAAKPNPK